MIEGGNPRFCCTSFDAEEQADHVVVFPQEEVELPGVMVA